MDMGKRILIVLLIVSVSFFSLGLRAASEGDVTYSVSGNVVDNYGFGLVGVAVNATSTENMDIGNTTITDSEGYYLVAGLPNSTYNFSYSKDGFNTGYLDVTISGSDIVNPNITINDTTPPVQVTGLSNDTPTQTAVNLSWNPVVDANYYEVFRDSMSRGYTQSTYWNDTELNPDTLYEYFVRANDSYDNWGPNSTVLEVTTAQSATVPTNYTPLTPASLFSTQGNFWINYTWEAGAGNVTNSYNVSQNGTWHNDTTDTYFNSSAGPHGWSNITVWAYNNSGSGSLSSEPAVQNTQVENNQPVQDPIGDQTINEGELLTFTVHATDADYDTVTYGTNATEGTFNSTTGQFSWTPDYGDAGTYVWYFNSSDSYGGVASETITVAVNDIPLTITSSSPPNNPTTIVGTAQQFEININRTANVTWYINGSEVQTNSSVLSASYTNSTAGIGVYNVTAIASDAYDSVPKTWIWTVAPEPRYNVSGYVSDNYGAGLGGVLVQNGSSQNTTIASGYYLITGLLNGTYNFSYSKAGFDTGYLEVTISGADNTGANIRIYDTTPPLSVSDPDTSTAVGSFFINNSWVNPSEDFNHTWFRYSNGTDLKNVSAPNLNLTWQPHYIQNISAQAVDKYGNVNQTKIWFNATIPNNPINITNIFNSYYLTEGQTLTIDANYTDADGDIGIFSDNSEKWSVNSSTGVLSWTTGEGDENIYHWQITVNDGNGSADAKDFTVTVGNSTPETPLNLVNSTGNFWVRYDWSAGANIDSFNVSYNGTWTNGSSATYINRSVGPHGWGNITVYGWNNTLKVLSSGVSQNTQVPNNEISIKDIQDSYYLTEGQTLTIDANYTDIDNDTGIFDRNFSQGDFDTSTGILSWKTKSRDKGIYYWYINVSDKPSVDAEPSVATKNFIVFVGDSTPTSPQSLQNTTGNFWINWTWTAGSNADDYDVWINGSDLGTDITGLFYNGTYPAHAQRTISVRTHNHTLDSYSEWANQTTTIPNNDAMLSNISSSYTVFENNPVSIYPAASDLDNDTLAFGSNITKGTFYATNGTFLWTPDSTEGGITYNWYINVSDGFSTNTTYFTVTVIDSTPAMPVNLTNKTALGNFWVNYTWEKGANTDLFNVSYNGTWDNSSAATFINRYVGPHGWGNITVCSYNASSWQTTCGAPQNIQVPNNPIIISNISDNYSLVEGQTLSIYANYTDADGASDLLTFDSNFKNDNFNKTTGVLNWKTVDGDEGDYLWQINVTDIYGAVSAVNFTVHVGDSTPGVPINLSNGTGNFWVNYTWEKGANTDSFNISQNGTWYNSSANFFNASVGSHGWSNISIAGYNNTLGAFSGFVPMNTQIPNNIPSAPAKAAPVNWQNLSDGNVRLSWEKSIDEDGDNLTYDWQLSDQSDFSIPLQSGNTEILSADLYLPPGTYYWRVSANDSSGSLNWSQSATPDFQIVSAPGIDNIRVSIITNNSIKIEWLTNQSDSLNSVKYGYNPDLSDGSLSSWSNNTNNPGIIITGLTGQSVYYQAISYNASNSSSYSNSSILNFSYPLQVSLYYIEPYIDPPNNGTEKWRPASYGHTGKFIGIDGSFTNIGDDSLNLTINVTTNKNKTSGPFNATLEKGKTMLFKDIPYLWHAFEISLTGVEGEFFNSTLQINVLGQNGSYANITTIALPIYPIFNVKRTIINGNEMSEGTVFVSVGRTTTLTYILEANSSVELTNVFICDPFYPANKGCFGIPRLVANKPQNVSYTYRATTSDLSSLKCEDPIPCIINQATFTGYDPNKNIYYNDTDYVRVWVLPYSTDSPSSSSGGGGGGGGGGGVPLSEDFNNTERREAREMDVLAKSAATYVFIAADPVMVVAFVSSVSENEVPVAVEVLRNRSKFIGVDAPDKLYRYFNVFVGTSGFSRKVSNGVVVFRVNNSWLEENGLDPEDVSLYKWQGSEWVEKDTKIVESKPNSTYYASAVGNFSSFAVAGNKKLKSSLPSTMPDIPMPAHESGNGTNLTSADSNPGQSSGDLKIGEIFIRFFQRLFSMIMR